MGIPNKRGFFGIGIWSPKYEDNVGGLFRSAVAFGASFIFTIGRKYRTQCTDTVASIHQIPYYQYICSDEFINHLPSGCRIVCVEITKEARKLPIFCHPDSAVYLLGNEGNGIPESFMKDKLVVQIPTNYCLNVATAGAVVMYDRISKQGITQ